MFCYTRTRIAQHYCKFITSQAQRDNSPLAKSPKISSVSTSRQTTKPRNAMNDMNKREKTRKNKRISKPRLRTYPNRITIEKRSKVSQRSCWTSILLRYYYFKSGHGASGYYNALPTVNICVWNLMLESKHAAIACDWTIMDECTMIVILFRNNTSIVRFAASNAKKLIHVFTMEITYYLIATKSNHRLRYILLFLPISKR